MMRADDPNLPILLLVAEALGTLCDELVFVGGCAAGLLLTETADVQIRPTQDVDAIVEAVTLVQFYKLEDRLPACGFARDSESGVICRWKHRATGTQFDLMPTDPAVLGFANRWYPLAVSTADQVQLSDRIQIRLISAPAFVATKLEAFSTRGKLDFFSHDLEDILIVVDGRPALVDELKQADDDLRQAVGQQIAALLLRRDFENVLPGLISDPHRADIVLARLREIAS